ncbi:MAG: tetratricopeptide repeat protein [Candidatus Aminicenantaceae bacterium]|jgi:Tfp pilus assembly protein PilF
MKKEKAILQFFLIIIFLLVNTHSAAAQAGRGKARVAGAIVDEQGNPIPEVKIVFELMGRNPATRETKTNKKGEWTFMGMGSGNWQLTATAEGYVPTQTSVFVTQIGQNPKVVVTLEKIAVIDSSITKGTDLALIEEAGKLFEERKYDEALTLLQEFLANNPSAYQTHINIGDCYKEKGEYEKAEEEYDLALESSKLDEDSGEEMTAKAMAGKGDIYVRKGDLEKAQNYFKESIELLPDNEILPYNVGEIYFANQKLDEAIEYYDIAIQIKPDWSPPYYRQGLVYLNKANYAKAEQNFTKFLAIDPSSDLAGQVTSMLDYLEKIKK